MKKYITTITFWLIFLKPLAIAQSDELITRQWNVQWGFESEKSPQEVLEAAGVFFPQGSAVVLDRKGGLLVVKNTEEQIQYVESFVASIEQGASKQVIIRADLYEVPASQTATILRRTKVTGDDSVAVASIRNLAKKGEASLVSTISVVSQSGNRGKAESGKKHPYLTSYDFSKGVDTPKHYSYNEGTGLEVDPTLGADDVTMHINIHFYHSLEAPRFRTQEAVSPITGNTLEYQSPIANNAEWVTQFVMLDGQTKLIGTTPGLDPGVTLVLFVTANIEVVM